MPATLIERVVAVADKVLTARFGALEPLGKVFIDPALKNMTVPFGQRSAQKALKTFGRGSRIPLGDGDIFRAFLWWNESSLDKAGNPVKIGRTDLEWYGLNCLVRVGEKLPNGPQASCLCTAMANALTCMPL